MTTRLRAWALALAIAGACGPAEAPSGGATAGPTQAAASPTAGAATAAPAAPTAAAAPGQDQLAALLATCRPPATPTTASTEGPYYKAGAPERTTLVTEGESGTRIVLAGYVVTRSCAPVASAKVDLWQADAQGQYDNTGYRLRGYTRTDASGRYRIETVVPGEYSSRTPHIHVKVEAGGKVLTSQLYMPDLASNARDSIFRPELTLQIARDPLTGLFLFVVDLP